MPGPNAQSNKQRLILSLIHGAALLIAAWILLGGGIQFVFDIFGEPSGDSSYIGRQVVLACGIIYFLRMCITTFVFLKRQIPWQEVWEVGPFVGFVQIFLAVLTVYHKGEFSSLDWFWIGLYLFGSYLNTGSEWMRMIWKKDPANKGKLYTEGLFKYSMHINYFGDSVLFTAFAVLTGSVWALLIPIIMILSFIFLHIPKLDKYLQERYPEQFDHYAAQTKKFIPWIY